ncbi:putative two-component response regulator [Pseudoalteromonas luteoviolacea B = ATCC 29581]|nr:putative two-component response regulator [Pseudoalteromonas luteoviolacea B = ATCC 29581]
MIKSAQIIVVDDDPLNRLVLENTLNDDYDVHLCATIEQANSALQAHDIDLVLLDVQMGGGSGYRFIEQLKANIHTYSIPIIIVSHSNSFQDEARALDLGAMDYITKPFSPAIIKARVRIHLAIKKKNDLLGRLANIDGLTEIPNRRALEESFSMLWQQAKQSNGHLAFMLISIDYFKSYNDKHGYSEGDACLIKVAQVLEDTAEKFDAFAARFDGVRFAIVIAGLDSSKIEQCANSLHEAVEALKIPHQASPISANISLSIGGVLIKGVYTDRAADVFAQADNALLKTAENQSRFELTVIE